MAAPNPTEILVRLAAAKVDFIVVGMTAGVLRGAPVTTVDIDIVHSRAPENVERLLGVLGDLDAVYRHDPRRLRPREPHLAGPGHQLLVTNCGDLDCLGTIGEGESYDDLLPHAPEMDLRPGLRVRVIDLPKLIALKQKAARPKDLAAIPLLRATLAETLKRT